MRIGRSVLAVAVVAATVAPAAISSDVFEFRVPSGPVIRMTITIPASAPRVAKIEACRKQLGAPRLTYILATIDNRKGSKETRLAGAAVVTPSGKTIRPVDVRDVIGAWPDGKTVAVYNRCNVDLYNAWLNAADVLPGARSTTVLASTARIPAVRYVQARLRAPGDAIPIIRKVG